MSNLRNDKFNTEYRLLFGSQFDVCLGFVDQNLQNITKHYKTLESRDFWGPVREHMCGLPFKRVHNIWEV